MRSFIKVIGIFLLSSELTAQPGQVTVTGTVVETQTNLPIEFATVAIVNPETDKPITGTTSSQQGSFSVSTSASNFYVEISFIGFSKKVIRDFQPTSGKVDLGTIIMQNDSKQLDEIVVEGEKSKTEFHLDKRVFNVGADLSSSGASALDVLNKVPSVNVNIEGQISLRGSTGVQMLINGKPSVLASEEGKALGTITADMIEQIEVITNPSAKYDAEGSSGIINVVLKKEERKGTNGALSVNTGTPHNHSIGFSLNRRSEKFNLFTQLGVGYKELPNHLKAVNENLLTDTTIYSTGIEYRNELYYNVVLGTDYHINDNNVVTVSGNYALELEDQPSSSNYTLLTGGETVSEWKRTEKTDAVNPKYQFELQYKRSFDDHEDHDLLFSAIGSFFGKDQSSDFVNETISGPEPQDFRQKTATNFQEGKYTFKLDYTKPFSEVFTLETGGQYLLNDVGNDYSVQNLENDLWVIDSTQTNLFEYDQKVLGLYSTAAYEKEKWGIKLGLRMENTVLKTFLANTGQANQQNYTNLFPTVHTSYKAFNNVSFQLGYSRRIYRPRLWDLNPFFNIRNNFSIRQGNPDLLPEFTDSYEAGVVYDAGKISLNGSLYHRYTTGVIERISTFENNINYTKPENIGTNSATGIEINGKYDPAKWLTVNADFNYNYFARNGKLEGTVFDFTSDQWSSKVNSRFKLPGAVDIELTGHYRSAYQNVQSEVSDILFMDLGARKKIINGKGVINLAIRDVFASRIWESIIDQTDYSLYNRRMRGRFITLGFSYGFGKGEAMQYGGKFH